MRKYALEFLIKQGLIAGLTFVHVQDQYYIYIR